MRQEGEPSVEEILESIKQVIARDNRDTLQAERRRREPLAQAQPAEPVDLPEATDTLTPESTARAMRESLEALAMIAEPGARPESVRSGETSLEGLTRELLRPMLAQWLDQHLPAMVEDMVKAEIARIAGKKS